MHQKLESYPLVHDPEGGGVWATEEGGLLADFDQHNHIPIKNWVHGAHFQITGHGMRELDETGLNKIILK